MYGINELQENGGYYTIVSPPFSCDFIATTFIKKNAKEAR